MKMKLTNAQLSAIDCAGIFEAAHPDSPGEILLRDSIQGKTLELDGREAISLAASTVNDISNSEDYLAEVSLDADMRKGHRGASRAMQNLASTLWHLTRENSHFYEDPR